MVSNRSGIIITLLFITDTPYSHITIGDSTTILRITIITIHRYTTITPQTISLTENARHTMQATPGTVETLETMSTRIQKEVMRALIHLRATKDTHLVT